MSAAEAVRWRRQGCGNCGFPRLRPEGHAEWCERVRAANARSNAVESASLSPPAGQSGADPSTVGLVVRAPVVASTPVPTVVDLPVESKSAPLPLRPDALPAAGASTGASENGQRPGDWPGRGPHLAV